MVAFGNPVQGIIRPMGSPLIVGSYRVTCDYACHMARPNPIPGIDLNDATCGKPVLAMTTGTISLIRLGTVGATTSDKASIFRIKRPDGWEVGVAHLKIGAGFALNQQIVEGKQIGTVDKIGATACHVHMGAKNPQGVEVDAWPLLKQNGATEEGDVLQGANPVAVSNRRGTILGNNTRFRSSPFVKADNVLVEYDTGAQLDPDYIVEGTSALGTNKWYGAWGNVGAGKAFGYVNVNAVSSLVPIEQSGHSDADLIKAVQTAGHNAAVDVSAAAATAAAKYPKP